MENFENIFKTICRICLSYGNSENMVSLTDNTTDDGLSSYGKAVLSLTSFSVKTECLLDKMCAKCGTVLEQVIMFKRMCENSTEKLTKFMHNLDSLDTQAPDFKEKLCEYVLFMDCKNFQTDNLSNVTRICEERYLNTTNEEVKNEIRKGYHSDDELDESIDFQNDSLHDIKEENNSIDENQPDIKQEQDTISYNTDKRPKRKATKKKVFKYEDYSGTESDKSTDTEYRPGDLIGKQLKRMAKKKVPDYEHNSGMDRENCHQNKKLSYLQCKTCMKILREPYMPIHMRRCHNNDDEKRFICDLCGKKFFDLRDLQHHKAGVHGVTAWICNVCGYKARCQNRLKIHKRTHTGERPYKCDKCGLTFIRPQGLNKHAKLHMDKTIQCPYLQCSKKYHIREYMLSHFNGSHHRLYKYACNQCEATYASNLTVIKHLTNIHGIPKKDHGRIRKIDLVIPPDIKKILGMKK